MNTYHAAVEHKQQGSLVKTFDRYVSPVVAEKLLGSTEEGHLRPGSQEQAVTTMFAAVRNYTTLSRKTEPLKLITLLNTRFTAIINALHPAE